MRKMLLLCRLLLVSTFLYSGIAQIFTYKAMQIYILTTGRIQWLNHMMAPALFIAILIDLTGSICILIEYRIKFWGYFLGTYTLLLNIYFNISFHNLNNTIIFILELSLTGGLYLLALSSNKINGS